MNLRSGYPFWLIKNGMPYDYPKPTVPLSTDIVIMGGGISGALMGYYLANAGVDCIIADARTIGMGSTCASTSLLQYEIDTPLSRLQKIRGEKDAVRAYNLCAQSISVLQQIAKDIGFAEFEMKQSLYYAAKKSHTGFLKEEYAARKDNGFEVTWLDEAAIQQEYGFKAPGAILSGLAAQTNAYTFAHALHQYSISKGVKVFDRTTLTDIRHTEAGVTMRTGDGLTINAKKLVYANGYEAVQYIGKKILQLTSTYATISEHAQPGTVYWKNNALIWNTDDPYLYMRTTPDGRVLAGGRDEPFYNPEKRDRLMAAKTKKLVKDFNTLFPAIPFKPEFSWAGTFGATEDGLPFIGPYKKLPNSLFALGFGGNGITFSMIAAAILTDIITGKGNADAAIFSLDRI